MKQPARFDMRTTEEQTGDDKADAEENNSLVHLLEESIRHINRSKGRPENDGLKR